MNSITQGLLAAGCEVRVLSMCSDKHPVLKDRMTDEYRQATRFEAVHVDLGIHVLDAGVSWLCGESYHVKRFVSNEFAARLRQILDEEEFDIVHVESIFLTPYVPVIRKHSKAQIVLRAHNVEHMIWQRIAKSERNLFKRKYIKHLALTLRAYECEHVKWGAENLLLRCPSVSWPRALPRWKKNPTHCFTLDRWTGCLIKKEFVGFWTKCGLRCIAVCLS